MTVRLNLTRNEVWIKKREMFLLIELKFGDLMKQGPT